MKKLFVLLLGLVLSLGLLGCSNDPLVDTTAKYFVVGNFNEWGSAVAVDSVYEMEAIAKNDDRVASIKGELGGVEYLYILEVTLPTTAAGWDVTYTIDGTEKTYDGNLTVKVVKTDAEDVDNIEFWAQNKESGEINNLTPETFYLPTYAETVDDGSGTWGDNPVALEAGNYYVVFAQFEDGTRAMGLVEVPAE